MGEHGTGAETVCRCGHQQAAHEHYRRGSDCGVCGRDTCPAFTAAPARSSDDDSRAASLQSESNSA
jgi:hypothetical protein